MSISRRELLRRSAASAAAVTAAIASPAERVLLAAERATPRESGPLHFPIRLDRNHNAYGPSERVAAALMEAVNASSSDQDDDLMALQARVADEHGTSPHHVVIGSGSGTILRQTIEVFTSGRKPIVTAAPTFDLVGGQARQTGCGVVAIPLRPDGSHDLERMLASATTFEAGLVYICNPNNPTGTLTRQQDLETFLAKVPRSMTVVIDEAYHHYVDDASDYRSFVESAADRAGVIVTRSFSKIHGLAGMRIGYATAHPKTLARLAGRQSLAALNVVAARAAIAALDDEEYARASRMRNADNRQEFFNQANARMLRWLDSQTNFVMLSTSGSPDAVIAHFAANQIYLPRPFAPLEGYLRVSLGTDAQMREFWRVWDLMPHEHHM